MRAHRIVGLVLFLAVLHLIGSRGEAKILLAIPLKSVLTESKFILLAKVDSLDAEKLQAVLSVSESLKGKAGFDKLPVLLRGDAEANKEKQVPQLLKRIQVGTPVVLFVNQPGAQNFVAFGYTEGTWFQMTGVQPKDADSPRWSWGHFEPILRQTYKGTTKELRDLVGDVLSGKAMAPEVNKKDEPGIGPEIKMEPQSRRGLLHKPGDVVWWDRRPAGLSAWTGGTPVPPPVPPDRTVPVDFRITRGPMLAVIPSVLVVGPLAFLAMLFPAVFGGLILVANRWVVALSVVSTNTTLYLLYSWLVPYYPAAWWANDMTLWLTMTTLTFLGVWWAFQRRNTQLVGEVVATGKPATEPRPLSPILTTSGFGETIALTVIGILAVVWVFLIPLRFGGLGLYGRTLGGLSLWAKLLITIVLGLIAAVVRIALTRRATERSLQFGLPGENALLLTMLFASILFLPTFSTGAVGTGGSINTETAADGVPKFTRVAWKFRPPEPSWIASSPVVAGNLAYIGVVHGAAFRTGSLFAIDLETGKVKANFNNDGQMKDVFCSPTVADGCVYIGEGFHQHSGCKLYCLDAETLTKKWEFETGSHTESTPAIANGKVYFGAGDDGMYCLDAKTGKEVWHLNQLHIDSNPLVVGGKVYVGSGKGDVYKDCAIACLDAETGKEDWRTPIDLPAWGGAVLAGQTLLIGIGNGNFIESDMKEKPAGAVMGLDARTGKRLWRTDYSDGVLVRPVTDGNSVWSVGRDGQVVCLRVADGSKVWATDLKSPLVASPALVPFLIRSQRFVTGLSEPPAQPQPGSLIVATTSGQVSCLDPTTGKSQWTFDVAANADTPDVTLLSSPFVLATLGEGNERRRVLFGCGLNGMTAGVLYCIEDERKP